MRFGGLTLDSRPPPREHLDPRARTLWRLSALVQTVPMVLLTLAAVALLEQLK